MLCKCCLGTILQKTKDNLSGIIISIYSTGINFFFLSTRVTLLTVCTVTISVTCSLLTGLTGSRILNRFSIRKTCPCNVYPLEPHFYIAKLGFGGVYLFFLFLIQNIDCGYSLEPPRRGGSNVYPQSMFSAKIRKISAENFQFLKLKKSPFIAWASFRNVYIKQHY